MKKTGMKKQPYSPTGLKYLLAALLCFIAAVILIVIIRKFVLDANLRDCGANWYLPSFFFMTGLSFLILSIGRLRRYAVLILTGLIAGAALQEISQYFQPVNNFDLRDLIATVAGGTTVLAIFLLSRRKKHDDT
mgnify:CR=1 FL=1